MTSKALPAVGVEVAGDTEKNPGEEPLTGAVVVVVVPSGGVLEPSVVVVVGPGVVVPGVAVDVVAVPATVMLAEVPDMPEELSVTSSIRRFRVENGHVHGGHPVGEAHAAAGGAVALGRVDRGRAIGGVGRPGKPRH